MKFQSNRLLQSNDTGMPKENEAEMDRESHKRDR